jgi:predicted dehydrogenase
MSAVLVVGAGSMARVYAAALQRLDVPFEVVGRSRANCERFEEATGVHARAGGVEAYVAGRTAPEAAIVAVDVASLATTTCTLLRHGVVRLLVEKPGALHTDELEAMAAEAGSTGAEVRIAYNRRYYASVRRARELIEGDGGPRTCHFDFSEIPERVLAAGHPPEVLERWFLANSSHVVDLAFHLAGEPASLHAERSGSLPWHPSGSRFAGAGATDRGALFTYRADWSAPGSWCVEVTTPRRALVLRPLERLAERTSATSEREVAVDAEHAKPGIDEQTRTFVAASPSLLPTIEDQVRRVNLAYQPIAGEPS